MGLKNVGSGAIQEMLEARKDGPFHNFSDFLERVNLSRVNRKVMEALIQAGAFDTVASTWAWKGPSGPKPYRPRNKCPCLGPWRRRPPMTGFPKSRTGRSPNGWRGKSRPWGST